MPRKVMLIVIGLTLLIFSGCQQYSEGLVKSTNRTDETVAISALRNISTAQQTYSVSHDGDYATLSQLVDAGFLDSRYSSSKPIKQYVLTMNVNSKSYSCTADPDTGVQGRHFYIDSDTGVIRANDTKQASASDPPMQ
jgi:competence protein ComGC